MNIYKQAFNVLNKFIGKNKNKIDDETFYIIKDVDKVGFYGGVYFTGSKVKDVLGNDTKIAWPNGVDLPAVPGIPVEGFEGEDLDLSHLELQNGLIILVKIR